MQRLAELDNIIGIKDATGDTARGRDLVQRCGDQIAIYSLGKRGPRSFLFFAILLHEVIPFIAIQILVLGLLAAWPQVVTWLPGIVYG